MRSVPILLAGLLFMTAGPGRPLAGSQRSAAKSSKVATKQAPPKAGNSWHNGAELKVATLEDAALKTPHLIVNNLSIRELPSGSVVVPEIPQPAGQEEVIEAENKAE